MLICQWALSSITNIHKVFHQKHLCKKIERARLIFMGLKMKIKLEKKVQPSRWYNLELAFGLPHHASSLLKESQESDHTNQPGLTSVQVDCISTTHHGINLNPAEQLALFYCQPWPQEFVNVIFQLFDDSVHTFKIWNWNLSILRSNSVESNLEQKYSIFRFEWDFLLYKIELFSSIHILAYRKEALNKISLR